jgi:sugar lactone lactonase YvrE
MGQLHDKLTHSGLVILECVMKSFVASLLALSSTSLLLVPTVSAQEIPASTQIWRSDHFTNPEAVHVSEDGVWAYIGNQNVDDEDGATTSYMSRYNLQTGDFTARWIEDMQGPWGITSHRDHLIFSDRGVRLVIADRHSGDVLDVLTPPDGYSVLNDVAVDPAGRIYVTDTRGGTLFRVENGVWTVLFEGDDFTSANGVEFVDGWIYVVTAGGHGKLIRIDPETLDVTVLVSGEGSLDGVITDGRGGLLLSDIPGRLLHWSEAGGITVLDDFADEEIMLNSIGGTRDGTYVFTPHWREAQVSAFHVTYPEE